MKTVTKTKRSYNKVNSSAIARFKAQEIANNGNGAKAVRLLNPELLKPEARAFKLRKKSKETNATDFIDDTIQQIGVDAINRVGIMVNSTDERIATKNSHFVIEQIRGKATQKSISLTGKFKLQDVLE